MFRQRYMKLTSALTALFFSGIFFMFLDSTEIGEAMARSSRTAGYISLFAIAIAIFWMIQKNRKADEALVPLDVLSIILSEYTVFFVAEKVLQIGPYPSVKLIMTILAMGLYYSALKADNDVKVMDLSEFWNVPFFALDFLLTLLLVYNTVHWSWTNGFVAFVIGTIASFLFLSMKYGVSD